MTAEFVLTAVLGLVLGTIIVASASGLGTGLFGGWLIGIGANYGALAIHAVSLAREDVLNRALKGVDVERGLREYSLRQLTLGVPFWVAAQALGQAAATGRR